MQLKPFNVDVEVGQDTLVLAGDADRVPGATHGLCQKYVLRWSSMLIVAMATGWLIQRDFGVLLPGFSALLPGRCEP